MSNYTSVKSLNKQKILEIGMFKGPAEQREHNQESDSK